MIGCCFVKHGARFIMKVWHDESHRPHNGPILKAVLHREYYECRMRDLFYSGGFPKVKKQQPQAPLELDPFDISCLSENSPDGLQKMFDPLISV